jgi:hypothetical protein
MCLIQIKHTQIKFPLFSFWTVYTVCKGIFASVKLVIKSVCLLLESQQNLLMQLEVGLHDKKQLCSI